MAVLCLPFLAKIFSVLEAGEGKTGVPGEKPLGEKERTKTAQPHMASTAEF